LVAWRNLIVLGFLAGCGPVQYLGTVTQTASSAVAAARSANAEKYAPYEYTSAVEYLHKAREEEGYADHEAAVKFGRLATQFASKAKEIAIAKAGAPPEPSPMAAPGAGEGEEENPLDQVPKK